MKKLTKQNIRHQKSRAAKELRNRVKRRERTYSGLPSYPRTKQYNSFSSVNTQQPRIIFKDMRAPAKFDLHYENCNGVINFVNDIKRLGSRRRPLNIIMDDITAIGEGAIAMLLSVIDELSRKGVLIKGSKPKPGKERDILEKSGFFKHMRGNVDTKNVNSKNTILKTGGKSSGQVNIADEIKKANETVWGEKGRNPPMRGSVYEMMRNSCDHAFKYENSIIWHFAISHNEVDKEVKFSFVDNGRGIIKSFVEGLLSKVISLFKDNADVLETAFKDGIESRTGLSWRGKGLPTIFENYQDGYMKSLVVISNDVYIDFDNNIHRKLEVPFSGTYYFWILNKDCIKACFIN